LREQSVGVGVVVVVVVKKIIVIDGRGYDVI